MKDINKVHRQQCIKFIISNLKWDSTLNCFTLKTDSKNAPVDIETFIHEYQKLHNSPAGKIFPYEILYSKLADVLDNDFFKELLNNDYTKGEIDFNVFGGRKNVSMFMLEKQTNVPLPLNPNIEVSETFLQFLKSIQIMFEHIAPQQVKENLEALIKKLSIALNNSSQISDDTDEELKISQIENMEYPYFSARQTIAKYIKSGELIVVGGYDKDNPQKNYVVKKSELDKFLANHKNYNRKKKK